MRAVATIAPANLAAAIYNLRAFDRPHTLARMSAHFTTTSNSPSDVEIIAAFPDFALGVAQCDCRAKSCLRRKVDFSDKLVVTSVRQFHCLLLISFGKYDSSCTETSGVDFLILGVVHVQGHL